MYLENISTKTSANHINYCKELKNIYLHIHFSKRKNYSRTVVPKFTLQPHQYLEQLTESGKL